MACAHNAGPVAATESADPVISHFIPSVELTGSREDKLRKLDTLIAYLHRLRGQLAGDATGTPATTTHITRAWPWFMAGFIMGAACVLLLATAGRWGL